MPVIIPDLPEAPVTARVNGGPSVVEFFDFFFSDGLGFPQDDFDLFIQWDVSGGSVDLAGGVGPGVFGAPPEDPNGRYVDLGGSTGDPGQFATRLAYPIIAGQVFNLTFDYRSTGGDFNTATVTVGNETWTVSTDSTRFQRFSRDFVASETGLVQIVFQGDEADTDNSGIGIDGVLFGSVLSQSENEVLVASPNPNHLEGRGGDDVLIGAAFTDRLDGGEGDDRITGGLGDDLLIGGAGRDLLDGGLGTDTVNYRGATSGVRVDLELGIARGGGSDDRLIAIENVTGSAQDDRLSGNALANVLNGDAGDDLLIGAGGSDTLRGGAGADRFRFESESDSMTGAIDRIVDFAAGDVIDLALIDANADTAGNQRFTFIGDARFSGTAGELMAQQRNGFTLLMADVDGDRMPDFTLRVDGTTPLAAADFML